MSGEFDDDFFTIHTVTVETLTGAGAYGDVFAAPVDVTGFLDRSRRLVRNVNGEQVVSESTFFISITNAALFTTDTKVTASGVVARVIKVNVNDSGTLNLPDHVEVTLT